MDRTVMAQARREMTERIGAGRLETAVMGQIMTQAFGGTDASGAWDWRLAFDLMQGAALDADAAMAASMTGEEVPAERLRALTHLAMRLPTETRRAERQIRLQQFSTPLPYAHVAATALALRAGEAVLEPSAGCGALAHMARRAGARLALNEIDATRAAILEEGFGTGVTRHDAEHIADLFEGRRPGAILMNPPFSSSASREGDPTIAARHLLSAARLLAMGGRLVAILPERFSPEREPGFWKRLASICIPRLHLTLPGRIYAKLGTGVSTVLLVCDKGPGSDGTQFVRHAAPHLEEALDRVLALPPRCAAGADDPEAVMQRIRGAAAPARTAPAGKRKAGGDAGSAGATKRAVATPAPTGIVPLAISVLGEPRFGAPVSEIYAAFTPQRIEIAGAIPHPSPLVESLAMASVLPPVPTAELSLPAKLVSGELSVAQLESVLMAESAFAVDLPGALVPDESGTSLLPASDCGDGDAGEDGGDSDGDDGAASAGHRYRQGWFLGDGTGAGKGRQAAGIMMAGWIAGRTRAIWISASDKLIEDARRDWADLGGAPTDIQPLSRWKPQEPVTLSRGILFVTYATLRAQGQGGETRLDQVLDWAGEGFEGVIAFDEAHAMQNAAGSAEKGGDGRGGRGKAPSQRGIAGLRLQNALPRARILYVSATGATTVANLAYATRLGLWGPGIGYPFASREGFVSAMEAGGVAAMEVVARDLKALGLYTARALSFEGTEYDVLQHELTPAQVEIYDTYAKAFRTIHQNLDKALEATGIVDAESGQSAGAAKAAAKSRFASTSQRFFGGLLHAMKAPTIIAAIEEDIAAGWAPVIQVVSTGESLLKRRMEEFDTEEDDLTEGHLTPKELVLDYLEKAFPIHAHEIVEIDGQQIVQPLLDADGNRVVSRAALEMRDAMVMDIQCLAPMPAFLDQLVWHFGGERVAEVTGRSMRPEKLEDGSIEVRRRSASANASETRDFMAGEKDLLVFSDAGGTGRSYHASVTVKNRKRRRHYLVEPGWRADAAIQGLGRTHRSAQAQPPFFRLCTSNVRGETRFTSTIARRLDTLGACTRGSRQTGSQNLFRPEDNLESPIARASLRGLYHEIVAGTCEAMTLETFEDWTALRLVTSEGAMLEELPPMSRFLNRVLALPIAMQNALFGALMEKIETMTERARAAGRLDTGLEMLRAETIREIGREDLWTCPKTGSVTRLVHLQLTDPVHVPSGAEILKATHGLAPFRNAVSGKVALIENRPRQVFEDDMLNLVREMRRHRDRSWIDEEQFGKSHWERIDRETFLRCWDAEARDIPKTETRDVWLLTGLLLPIWTRIPSESERIYRVTPEGGTAMIGRALGEHAVAALRAKFLAGSADTPGAMVTRLRGTSAPIETAAGLRLQSRRVAGTRRLEVTGFSRDQVETLKAMGCFTEIIAHQLRVFIPDTDQAEEIVARITGIDAGRAAA